jgi:hypothetical protein
MTSAMRGADVRRLAVEIVGCAVVAGLAWLLDRLTRPAPQWVPFEDDPT